MTGWRYRLARWLVGPFFALPHTGSWMVYRNEAQDLTMGVPVFEWHGELTTTLEPLEYTDTRPVDFDTPRTTGTFSGTFAA